MILDVNRIHSVPEVRLLVSDRGQLCVMVYTKHVNVPWHLNGKSSRVREGLKNLKTTD